ncbi:M28 family metallopeptidase [Paraurantiacibacter namhicola]|uniref:Bacterial leucyl aminopeptidase n=1 Tax=Paraurantiacibacter namhicola TaxID=645517 RepID=A0A1C7D6A4_9SPHN|nr:M28 family metallopeptidase [Paraurantiacibacter namhicola]ANU06892.1 Bacterial leucyl aminopeptidase precursor [Paraurantiacibacter namhicola]
MTFRPFLAAAALCGLAACATPTMETAEGGIPDVTPQSISLDTMKDITRTLSDDSFEGRAPGTPGGEKTVAYLIEQFEGAGLQPGNNGSWCQDVPLVEITGRDFQPLVVTGGAQALTFEPQQDWVGVSYREVDSVAISDAELVFVGYGINAPEKGWNDYAGLDMRGKIAVILVNDPDWRSETLEGTFNGRAMTYYGRWTYKYEEAARQGAAGALVIHQTEPASYGWNVVESSWSGPQAYAQRGDGGASQTMMNGWITEGAASAIFDSAGQDFAAMQAAATQAGFKPVPLGLTASTGFQNDFRRFSSRNVIGILPGSTRPDEYVLHTAHWDHLGRCTPDETGDDICNGAIDNASGTAALVALAQAHANKGPAERTLVFLAVTAEESGLLGSEYYGANPVFPLDRTVGGVNMDALVFAGAARDVSIVGPGKSELDAYLMKGLAMQGRVGTPNPSPQAGYYYRSDHFSLAKRGVPMLYVKSGDDLVNGGREAGAAYQRAYRATAYHRPGDEYDANWDWSGVMQDLELFYVLGRMMADTQDWPNWNDGDEFRRIRDESCAAPGGC